LITKFGQRLAHTATDLVHIAPSYAVTVAIPRDSIGGQNPGPFGFYLGSDAGRAELTGLFKPSPTARTR